MRGRHGDGGLTVTELPGDGREATTAAGTGPTWERAPRVGPGNHLATKHGAGSSRLVRERVEAMLADLEAEDAPWLATVDRSALAAWAWAESSCGLLRDWLAEREPLNPEGRPWPGSELLLKWERRAADERGRLGFDPLSRARMRRDQSSTGLNALGIVEQLQRAGAALVPEPLGTQLEQPADGDPVSDE